MDNSDKLTAQCSQDKEKQNKAQRNMCWTPLDANKHK